MILKNEHSENDSPKNRSAENMTQTEVHSDGAKPVDHPPADNPSDNPQPDDTARTTGRGFLVITGAKLWFMVTGAVIQLGLPIFLGSPEKFGVFKIVTESISLINMVMITGTLQAVSKMVSEQPVAARRVVNQALKLQCFLGVPIAAAYALGSPWIADQFNDPSLTPFIRLSSLIILFYAFYAIFIGYFNGTKTFVRQATMDITFTTTKMVLIVGLVLLGFGVMGAIAGFVAAAGMVCMIAGIWVWRIMRRGAKAGSLEPDPAADRQAVEQPSERPVDEAESTPAQALKRLLGYLVLVMLYTFALNGLMRADLFMLKRIAAEVPAHLAGAEGLFNLISSKFAGLYGAALNIARIPYMGVIAVTFVIFPLISASTFAEDRERTQNYISDTFRYCLLLIAGVGGLLALNSDSIIAGLYSSAYHAAAPALAILSVSIIFFALYYVATTIIIGAGRPGVAVVIMTVSMLISGGLNYAFINQIHEESMADVAWTPLAVEPVEVVDAASARQAAHAALAVARNRTDLAGPFLHKGPNYMKSAATATTIAMLVGFLLSLLWLWRAYKAGIPAKTLARVLASLAVLAGVDYLIDLPVAWVADFGKLAFLGIVVAKMALMGLLFIGLLFALREFGAQDLARVKAVVGKK
jgi:O-antigen/teichoic acid export membrane protein